jgi:predicted component of type VI protein secretion system
MPTLTLSFKGHFLSIHHLEGEQPVTIGRDGECSLRIDSLAISPQHAELLPTRSGYLLLALDPESPVLLNGAPVKQAPLRHGDLIQLGKHTLSYSEDSLELAPRPTEADSTAESVHKHADSSSEETPAYFQVQNGPQIGRVFALRRAVTRLTRLEAAHVIVKRRGGAFYLSQMGNDESISVAGNRLAADRETELHHNDVVDIGALRLRFFAAEEDPGAEPIETSGNTD